MSSGWWFVTGFVAAVAAVILATTISSAASDGSVTGALTIIGTLALAITAFDCGRRGLRVGFAA